VTPAAAANPIAAEPAPGITLLISRPGEDPLEASHGYANLEHRVPISADTRFNVGSVAKQITAHLVLLAAEDGRLDLDLPADALLPELRVPGVTPADLITHHSGLRDAESLLSLAGYRDLDHYTSDDLSNLASRQRQRAVPRGQFLYSNTNYLLLARLLERLHGRPFPAIAEDLLFGPLGMTATCFETDPRQVLPDASSAYESSPEGRRHVAAPAVLPGPGGLWSTTRDLGFWLSRLHSLWTKNGTPGPRTTVLERSSDHPPARYGPGLYTLPDEAEVFHYGHEQGFSAAVRLTADGRQVVALSNGGTLRADKVAAAALDAPAEAVTAITQQLARPDTESPSPGSNARGSERHTEIGRYVCPDVPGSLRITEAGGTLYLWRRGTPCALNPVTATDYRGPGLQLVLSVDASGGSAPASFVLNLQRAPGLRFHPT
jgi:CubicO group peptidase (beta-lactamase class C family)